MRVVGVTRLLNEADLVEPFIRHHAALLDLHILLDGGSTDETVGILRALHSEGLNIQVYQTSSPIFLEQAYNNGLYRLALGEAADWVFFLDADEMLVTRGTDRAQPILELVPADIACLRLSVFRYAVPPVPDDAHAFECLAHRESEPHMPKIAVRRLDPARVAVYPGNHFAYLDGRHEPGLSQDRLVLAHLPERSPLQAARRAILGRLKVLASGRASAENFTTHLEEAFERLKTDPRAWLAEAMPQAAGVADPVLYRGGPLRYTKAADDLARLLALFAAQGELLARSHGAILDRKRLIRRQLQDEGRVAHRLF